MKVSQIQLHDVVDYMRLEPGQYKESELQMMIDAAKAHIKSYTGLSEKDVDQHEEFSIAFYALVNDFFENRSLQADKSNINLVIDSILGMHRVNLLPGAVK